MIIFVIPLVSAKVSKDWLLTQKLLQGTLDSIDNQTNRNFKVVVSCHEIPNVSLKSGDDNLYFMQMSYSPFSDWCRGKSETDRMVKCCRALFNLKDEDFQYCMVIDADDRIHCDLVEFVFQQPIADGWIIDKGFQVDYALKRVFEHAQLSRICASTFILSKSILNIPKDSTGEEYSHCIYARGHQTFEEHFRQQGLELSYLPFRGVQYIVNHGINSSNIFRKNFKDRLKRLIKFRFFARKMSQKDKFDFGYMNV